MSKQPSSSFEVFTSIASFTSDPPESIHSFQNYSRPNLSQPPKLRHPEPSQSKTPILKASSSGVPTVQHPQLHSEISSNSRQDLRLQSRRLSSLMLKTCTPIYSRQTVVDNDKISCMQSQPSRQQSQPLQQIRT